MVIMYSSVSFVMRHNLRRLTSTKICIKSSATEIPIDRRWERSDAAFLAFRTVSLSPPVRWSTARVLRCVCRNRKSQRHKSPTTIKAGTLDAPHRRHSFTGHKDDRPLETVLPIDIDTKFLFARTTCGFAFRKFKLLDAYFTFFFT